MSTSSVGDQLLCNFLESKDYRHAFIEEKVRTNIALQINAIREQRVMTQSELGDAMDKSQSWIARLEDPNQAAPTIPSLLQVAEAFDVDLDIRFVPFSRFLNGVDQMNPETFKVNSFEDEHGTLKQEPTATVSGGLGLSQHEVDLNRAWTGIHQSVEAATKLLAAVVAGLSKQSEALEKLGRSLLEFPQATRQTYQTPRKPEEAATTAQAIKTPALRGGRGGLAELIPIERLRGKSPYKPINPSASGAVRELKQPA